MGRSRLRQGALLPLCATLFLTPALRAQQYHLTPLPPVVIQQPFSAPASGLTVTAPATTSPGSITFTAKKVTPAPDLPRNAGPFTLTLTAPDPLHVASITAATGQYSIYTLSQLETFTLASQASNFQFLGLNVYQGPLGANIPLPACNFSIVNSQTNKCVVNSLYAPTGTVPRLMPCEGHGSVR